MKMWQTRNQISVKFRNQIWYSSSTFNTFWSMQTHNILYTKQKNASTSTVFMGNSELFKLEMHWGALMFATSLLTFADIWFFFSRPILPHSVLVYHATVSASIQIDREKIVPKKKTALFLINRKHECHSGNWIRRLMHSIFGWR